ncbi:742_t:CDS:2 [Acaulospora morrowiae]|uniref:742_t:CDS:1 n=1 Tax=Acaulospora morrowiae TaxID=94023 RepID=A0A9N9C6Q8_9GLOM|nr:742_t:CDS:2 [Acaulospora morrowiae]
MISLPPNIEDWSPRIVLEFLKANKKKLHLTDEMVQAVKELDYSGKNYLRSNENELRSSGLSPGAVIRILEELEEQANKCSDQFRRALPARRKEPTPPQYDNDQDCLLTTPKSSKKRSLSLPEEDLTLPNTDEIHILREKFRRIYNSRKESEGLTFVKIAKKEIDNGYIGKGTLSNFYNGKSDLNREPNLLAIKGWIEKYETNTTKKKKI